MSDGNRLLVADLSDVLARDVEQIAGYTVRASSTHDLDQLGRLYFTAYDEGIACATLDEAVADIAASFAGEYGTYWFEASPVVEHDDAIVAALMTVRRAPWPDVPDCPFIIELFTDRKHRRRGLASRLVHGAAAAIADEAVPERTIALRVADDNVAARELYRRLGFEEVGRATFAE